MGVIVPSEYSVLVNGSAGDALTGPKRKDRGNSAKQALAINTPINREAKIFVNCFIQGHLLKSNDDLLIRLTFRTTSLNKRTLKKYKVDRHFDSTSLRSSRRFFAAFNFGFCDSL